MAKRAEALGVILFTFIARSGVERIFIARLPPADPSLIRTITACTYADPREEVAQAAAQRSVVEYALAQMGKRRTPAHVVFFNKLERPSP